MGKGFVVSLKGENDSIMYHLNDSTATVPLFLHRNSLRVHTRPFLHHVSPVVVDHMPLRQSWRSPSNLLDRRLDELALPKHGTKLDKWTRLEKRENELVRERKSQAAIDAALEAGLEGRLRDAAIQMSDPREPSSTEKEVHELTHLLPQPWCERCVKGRGMENPHKRVTIERAESTLHVIAVDFCFIKTSGIAPGVTADEGATCLVLLDVDTGYMKAVPAAGRTVTDCLIEGGKRFVEQFFQRRVRLRCAGEPATLAYGGKLKELLAESVVLERTLRHDSRRNPSERAVRTLEEQVKVMPLNFEERTGSELLANSRLWPWLVRHAGWVDARLRVNTNGATPYQDACDSTYTSELLPFGELVLFRLPLPHTRRTNQNRTIYRGDSGCDKGFWCGLDEDNAHIIVTESGLEIARTVRILLPSERAGCFFAGTCEGDAMGWTGLVRRGRPPKLTLETLTMAETGETLRSGGSRRERDHLQTVRHRDPPRHFLDCQRGFEKWLQPCDMPSDCK